MNALVYYAVPAFVVLQIMEAVLLARRKHLRGYEVRDTLTSLTLGVGNVFISLAAKAATLGALFFIHQFAVFDIGYAVGAWAALIVCEDFCYYWFHRMHHEIRFLWAAHVNHHSSRHFNLSTALRQTWTTPFTGPIFWWPLAFLGFHPLMIVTAQSISLLYQFWIHTELIGKLGPLEWVLNTPSHHRVHHGRNVEYLDRNYAGIFIIWDRLFGSFEPEQAPMDYGITKQLDSFNPIWAAFHEWVALFRDLMRSRNWRERWGYMTQPPGWSPDGSSLTARQLQGRAPLPSGGLAPPTV